MEKDVSASAGDEQQQEGQEQGPTYRPGLDRLFLQLGGKLLGTITVCTSDSGIVQHNVSLESPAQQRALSEWFQHAHRIISEYWSTESWRETQRAKSLPNLSRDILTYFKGSRVSSEDYTMNESIYNNVAWLNFSKNTEYIKELPLDEVSATSYWEVVPYIIERKFFQIDKGVFGCGPRHLCVGDHLIVIAGVDVPFIVRSAGEDEQKKEVYRLLGECAVASSAVRWGLAWQDRDHVDDPCEFNRLPVQSIMLV